MSYISTIYGDLEAGDVDLDLISQFLLLYGEWGFAEALVATTLLESNDVLWDIGAHLGTFTLGVAKNARLGRVLCIEANPSIFDDLQTNLTRNLAVPFDSALAGVSSQPGYGIVQLDDPSNHGAARFVLSVSDYRPRSQSIPATTLKDLRAQYGCYSFLKLDIEGMEVDAIDGDADFIRDFKPVIWAECNQNEQSFALLDRILSLGYEPCYVAFPSIRSDNFNGNRDMLYPMAYEAALVAAIPERLERLSTGAVTEPCIVRYVKNHDDLRRALWDTPRWSRPQWVELSKPELVAQIGHLDRGERFDSFIKGDFVNVENGDIHKTQVESRDDASSVSGMVQVFWVSTRGSTAVFNEQNSQATSISINGNVHLLNFTLPVGHGPLNIRIDPMDRVSVLTLGSIKLMASPEKVLWVWDGDYSQLHNMVGVVVYPAGGKCNLICVNNDSQFEVSIPPELLTGAKVSVSLAIEISAEELDQALPRLLRHGIQNAGSAPVTLAKDLASLTQLVSQTLARKDQTIAQQHQHLRQMQDGLLRAEAQIDLLKDVMLNSHSRDLL